MNCADCSYAGDCFYNPKDEESCPDRYCLCEDNMAFFASRRVKRNKHSRYAKHLAHLKYLERVSYGYLQAVTYTDTKRTGHGYVENPKPYYKRWYRTKRSSYLKKQANKKIRRYKGELHNGYQNIHKIFDFWWEYD